MSIYKKFIIILANNLFRLLLFFSISIVAMLLIYTDRSYISTTLERNDSYNRFVDALLETNKDQPLTVGGSVTLNDPEIQQIITTAFPADELELYVKNITNAFYDWLEQDNSEVEFRIDLTQNKQLLAEGLSNYAIDRMQSLPLCLEVPKEIDPFNATCQSPNIDYDAERQALTEKFLNEPGFLENPVITKDSLLPNSFESDYSDVPIYYSVARLLPIFVPMVLSALALIVIFTSSTKKIGMRKIGQGLVGAGISLIVFTVLFSFVLPEMTGSLPLLQTSGQGIDTLINEISINFGRDYAWMIIKLSIPLVLIGAGMLLYARIGVNKKDYKSAKLKSGVVSSNEQKKAPKTTKKTLPPIQSSESSETKPKRTHKNTKYRKIPKKEL